MLGSATLSKLAFLKESDPNFPGDIFPIGQQSKKQQQQQQQNMIYTIKSAGLKDSRVDDMVIVLHVFNWYLLVSPQAN